MREKYSSDNVHIEDHNESSKVQHYTFRLVKAIGNYFQKLKTKLSLLYG